MILNDDLRDDQCQLFEITKNTNRQHKNGTWVASKSV